MFNKPKQNELTAKALKDPLQYRGEVDDYLQKRRISNLLDRIAKQETIDPSMKALQPRVFKRLENKPSNSPEDVLFETLGQFANKPSLAAPAEAKAYENELRNIDIRDLLAILFSKNGERPLSLAEASEREGDLPVGVARFLRQERYVELVHGPDEKGAIAQRVSAARNSDFGEQLFTTEGALTAGRYALMASIIVGTGGAAIPGMVSMHVAKKVVPQIKDSLDGVKGRVETWLVENKVISQENLDKANERSKNKLNSFLSTRAGKTLSIVGGIAVCAGVSALMNDATGLDGVFDRVSTLWDGAQTYPEAAAAEVTAVDEPIEAPLELSSTEIEPSATLDVVPLEGSIAHPDGGFSAPGLLSATEGMVGDDIDAFRLALADMPTQMSDRDLSEAISEAIPSASQVSIGTLITQAGALGLDTEQLREAFEHPIADGSLDLQRAIAGTVFDQSGYAGYVAPNMLDGSVSSALSNGGSTITPPTLDIANPDMAATGTPNQAASPSLVGMNDEVAPPVDSSNMDTVSTPLSLDISIEVHSGDTLSNLVWDQYNAAGQTLSAADLYAPGPLSDHPGGVVGMIAEQNGIANPDIIRPGDTVQFGSVEQAPANEIKSDVIKGDPPPSMLAQHAENVSVPSHASSPLNQLLDDGVARLQESRMSERLAEQSPYNIHEIIANRLAEASPQPETGEPPVNLASTSEVHAFPAVEGYQPQMPESAYIAEVHGHDPKSPNDSSSELSATQSKEINKDEGQILNVARYSPSL